MIAVTFAFANFCFFSSATYDRLIIASVAVAIYFSLIYLSSTTLIYLLLSVYYRILSFIYELQSTELRSHSYFETFLIQLPSPYPVNTPFIYIAILAYIKSYLPVAVLENNLSYSSNFERISAMLTSFAVSSIF